MEAHNIMKNMIFLVALCATSLVWGIDVQNIDGRLIFTQDNKPISPNAAYYDSNIYFLNTFGEKTIMGTTMVGGLFPQFVDTGWIYEPGKDQPYVSMFIVIRQDGGIMPQASKDVYSDSEQFSRLCLYKTTRDGLFLHYANTEKNDQTIEDKGFFDSIKESPLVLSPQKISSQEAKEYNNLLFESNKSALLNLKNPVSVLKEEDFEHFIDSYKVKDDIIVWEVRWRAQEVFWIFDFSDPNIKIKVEAYDESYNLFSQMAYNGGYDFSQITFYQLGNDKCTIRVKRKELLDLSADIVVHKDDHALLYSLQADPENADFKLIQK